MAILNLNTWFDTTSKKKKFILNFLTQGAARATLASFLKISESTCDNDIVSY